MIEGQTVKSLQDLADDLLLAHNLTTAKKDVLKVRRDHFEAAQKELSDAFSQENKARAALLERAHGEKCICACNSD